MAQPMAHRLAGRYEVRSLIGRGGMAEVHLGFDTRLSRVVAIKMLRRDLAQDSIFQARFRREAQSASSWACATAPCPSKASSSTPSPS